MPKNKSHSGLKKRVKVTAGGKLRVQHSGMRHNMERKASTLTRRHTGAKIIADVDAPRFKKMMGI